MYSNNQLQFKQIGFSFKDLYLQKHGPRENVVHMHVQKGNADGNNIRFLEVSYALIIFTVYLCIGIEE